MDELTVALTSTDHRVIVHENLDLEGYQVDDAWYIAMRRLCRSLDIDWSAQRQRIMRDTILSEGVVMINTPSAGGEQATVGLRFDLFWGWLFKLELSRLSPALQDLILPIQRAGYEALHRHFTGQSAARPALAALPSGDLTLETLSAHVAHLSAAVAQLRAQSAQASRHAPVAVSYEAQAVLDAMAGLTVPVGPSHVARLLAIAGHAVATDATRVRMRRLEAAGYLVRAGHGLYLITPNS